MNKKFINKKLALILGLLILVLTISSVSAGLCKGWDGYYHDCSDYYYEYYERAYDWEYDIDYKKDISETRRYTETLKKDADEYKREKIIFLESKEIEELKKSPIKKYYRYKRIEPEKYRDYYPSYKYGFKPRIKTGYEEEPASYRYRYYPSDYRTDWKYKRPYRYREYSNENPYDYDTFDYDEYIFLKDDSWRWQ